MLRFAASDRWLFTYRLPIAFLLLLAAVGSIWTSGPCRIAVLVVATVWAAAAVRGGIRRFEPYHSASWWGMLSAIVIGGVGAVMRARLTGSDEWEWILPYALMTVGYLITTVAFAGWLHEMDGRDERSPLLDGVLIAVGSFFVSWVLVLSPTLEREFDPDYLVLTRVFLVFDVALLAVVAYVMALTSGRSRTIVWFVPCVLAISAGDIVYSVVSVNGGRLPGQILDPLLIFPLITVGLAALEPTMARLPTTIASVPVRGGRRLAVVVTLLLLCSAVAFVGINLSPVDLVARSVLLGALLIGTVLRSEHAMRSLRASEDSASHRAAHDSLTDLPNQRTLRESFRYRRAADDEWWLMFIDLDDFKTVNDSHGHQAGDELIARAATRIKSSVGSDGEVYRYAGDEFVVVGSGNAAAAERVAAALMSELDAPFTLSAVAVDITATIGIALSPFDNSGLPEVVDAEAMLLRADRAMYLAKSRDRRSYAIFDDALKAKAAIEAGRAAALVGALGHDEFELLYQPVVELKTRETVALQALLRWRDGDTLRTPTEFVEIAESLRLMSEIGMWVLRTAIRDFALLREGGFPELILSIELSDSQLRNDDLPDAVAAMLALHALEPSSLDLTVSESAVSEDSQRRSSILRRFSEIGVRLTIHGFGSGETSLSRLFHLPVAAVRVDAAIATEQESQLRPATFAASIVAVANFVDVETVAMGIDTDARAVTATRIGFGFAQGLLFGEPVPLAQWRSAESVELVTASDEKLF